VFISKLIIMMILSSYAEIKIFYIEMIIILSVGMLITKFSWKKVLIIAIGILSIGIGYKILVIVYPNVDMSVEGLFDYATNSQGYTSSDDFNRFNFMSAVNDRYLISWFDRVFGLGMGNCDYATGKAIVTSPFYIQNEHTHYYWMSSIFMYLENGWLGLLFFVSAQ